MKQLKTFAEHAPTAQRALFAGSTRNLIRAASVLASGRLQGANPNPSSFLGATMELSPMAPSTEAIRVSSSRGNLSHSVLGGFTQNESSAAWCGDAVVVGFNDTGSILEIQPDPSVPSPGTYNGVAFSANGGRSFNDSGFLRPGPDPASVLGGDPVVACVSNRVFYYSSLFLTAAQPDPSGYREPLTAVSISVSKDGGASWGTPSPVITKDGLGHQLDKDWMTIDPRNPSRIFVSYTDFDDSFPATGACANDYRTAIELVASSDGGATWAAPMVIDEECGITNNGVQGSQIAVADDGTVYVAFEFYDGSSPAKREIRIRTSTDHGRTFAPAVKISNVVPTGNGFVLQCGFRTNEFPSLTTAQGSSSLRGHVYVAWADGRNHLAPDPLSALGTYGYGDVLISHSSDSGKTWTAPVIVSPQPSSFPGRGRDQFMPAIAVDPAGALAVCYYDRREDPLNRTIDRFCSVSTNGGSTWTDSRKTANSWIPVHDADAIAYPDYMGDYDTLVPDSLRSSHGFFGAFQYQSFGEPSVWAVNF